MQSQSHYDRRKTIWRYDCRERCRRVHAWAPTQRRASESISHKPRIEKKSSNELRKLPARFQRTLLNEKFLLNSIRVNGFRINVHSSICFLGKRLQAILWERPPPLATDQGKFSDCRLLDDSTKKEKNVITSRIKFADWRACLPTGSLKRVLLAVPLWEWYSY